MSDTDIITQLNLSLAKGQKVVVAKDANAPQPNYYKVGNGTTNKHSIKSIDLIGELINMSKPAQTVIGWIKDGMVWDSFTCSITFVVYVNPSLETNKRILKKGFKELAEKDLVRRVRKSYYMINPKALITDYKAQMDVWNKLSANKSKVASDIEISEA